MTAVARMSPTCVCRARYEGRGPPPTFHSACEKVAGPCLSPVGAPLLTLHPLPCPQIAVAETIQSGAGVTYAREIADLLEKNAEVMTSALEETLGDFRGWGTLPPRYPCSFTVPPNHADTWRARMCPRCF